MDSRSFGGVSDLPATSNNKDWSIIFAKLVHFLKDSGKEIKNCQTIFDVLISSSVMSVEWKIRTERYKR